MKELKRFYSKCLIFLLFISTVLLVIATSIYEHPQNSNFIDKLLSPLTLIELLIGGFLLLGEKFIRTKLWKFKPFLSEYDFDGKWIGRSTYVSDFSGNDNDFIPFTINHETKIEQDCLSLALTPTTKSPYTSWASLATELNDKDHLSYAYYVNYDGIDQRFPNAVVLGIEKLDVVKRDAKKRPIEMTGKFWHCANGQKPIYGGSVVFKRSYLNEVFVLE